MKQHDLHRQLHEVFTKPWQERIRENRQREFWREQYEERFGAEDYAEIRRVKGWLQDHPQRQALMAYLWDDDPYQM